MMTLEAKNREAWGSDESALFGAGRSEGPSAESSASLYAALGLAPPLPGGGGGGQSSPFAAPIPLMEPVVQSGIFARPIARLAAGAGALALAIPVFLWLQPGDESSAPAATAAVTPSSDVRPSLDRRPSSDDSPLEAKQLAANEQPAVGENNPVATTPSVEDAVAIDSLPAAADPPGKVPTSGQATGKSERPTLKEEVALLQRAKSALSSGNISQCEALLQEHRTRFVPPRLASEARVLRVEAYVAQGRMTEAKAEAAPLLKADSPYRARMEKLLSK